MYLCNTVTGHALGINNPVWRKIQFRNRNVSWRRGRHSTKRQGKTEEIQWRNTDFIQGRQSEKNKGWSIVNFKKYIRSQSSLSQLMKNHWWVNHPIYRENHASGRICERTTNSARHRTVSKIEHKTLKQTLAHPLETQNEGLNYKLLNIDNVRIRVVIDASFSNARGEKSQLGYLIIITFDTAISTIIYYSTRRYKCLAISLMES